LNRYRHKFTKAELLFRNLVEEGHVPEMGRDTFRLQAVLQFGLIVARTPLVFLETAPIIINILYLLLKYIISSIFLKLNLYQIQLIDDKMALHGTIERR